MTKQSPELAGGAGFSYEANVAALYLGALLIEGSAPGLHNRVVRRVALQQAAFGEPLDDVIIDASGLDEARLSLQVKRKLVISNKNADFCEVVVNAWKTLKKPDFRDGIDRYGAATGTVSDDKLRDLHRVCDTARASTMSQSFFRRGADGGNVGASFNSTILRIREILTTASIEVSDDDLHRFLKHLVVIKFDFLHEEAVHPSTAVETLRNALPAQDHARAPDLWQSLVNIAREGAGRSAEFNRTVLVKTLSSDFSLNPAPSTQADLEHLGYLARQSIDDIAIDIGGCHIRRQTSLDGITQLLEQHRFVQIRGLPGTGKSALLRDFVSPLLADKPVLFLKSDRLSGSSWAEFAASQGLTSKALPLLLADIEARGTPTFFIDGIDRIGPAQRNVVIDLLNAMFADSASTWRVVATLRDAGIEPLRNWLPAVVSQGNGIGSLNVGSLDDTEAEVLAKDKPFLRPLLFGESRVRQIVRRPFFANILARRTSYAIDGDNFTPRSEIDLLSEWWRRGGYAAEPTELFKRQNALQELARTSALRLGLNINQAKLSPSTVEVLAGLIQDGVLQQVDHGLFKFSHDIFFEWSFYFELKGQEDRWIDALSAAGEPPVLGRVVELLSQARFISDDDWDAHLEKIETSRLRPQWRRAWLLGPLGAPEFDDHAGAFEEVVLRQNEERLGKLFVWFQAEKTTPNPFVLGGRAFSPARPIHETIRLADALGWPSDYQAWSRLITWTLDRIDKVPTSSIPDLVSVFEVWQNAYSDIHNTISERIVDQVTAWLVDIENRLHLDRWPHDYGPWEALGYDELKELGRSLRHLLLRSGRPLPEHLDKYLQRLLSTKKVLQEAYPDILLFSTLLAQQAPRQLCELAKVELLQELPEDLLKRWREEEQARARRAEELRAMPAHERSKFDDLASFPMIGPSLSHHDWHDLSVRSNHDTYPSSPLREPFASLFKFAPEHALGLVRDVSNHAITAWRQLHLHHYERQGTPIPLKLSFPWGEEVYWGDWPQYGWYRGWLGPHAIESALMALENWAFSEIERGQDIDTVLQQVLAGHASWAVTGIATAVCLEKQHISPVSVALVGCQRLWHIDIRRQIEDQGMASNLIGFTGLGRSISEEKSHYEAVRHSNERKCRKHTLRDLVPLHVFSKDPQIRAAVRAALESFPDNLPFDYEEERKSSSRVANLRTTAEIWAESGKSENYKASDHPSDDKITVIQLENPRVSAPDIQASIKENNDTLRGMALWSWVQETFESNRPSARMSLEEVINTAKSFDYPDVFQDRAKHDNDSLIGAIAGVAAAVRCFDREDPASMQWASDVLTRAYTTPEINDGMWSPHSIIPWHPCIFVCRALSADIRHAHDEQEAKAALLTLAGHPLVGVSLEAMKCAFACWAADDRYVWFAIDLGLRLCRGRRRDRMVMQDGEAELENLRDVEQQIEFVLDAYEKQSGYPDLELPPPPWVSFPPDSDSGDQSHGKLQWRKSDEYWRREFASQLLAEIPLDAIMSDVDRRLQFLRFIDGIIDWTLKRIDPPHEKKRKRRSSEVSVDLGKWKFALARIIADLSELIPASDVLSRFLQPIFDLEDELCASFLSSYVSRISCSLLDARKVSDDSVQLLLACTDRLIADHVFKRNGYSKGELYGFDLPCLVRDLFFVSIENASGAARFANGDWKDLRLVLPIIDKLVRTAGWTITGAGAFLTLCERSGEHYPTETFVDQVLAILDPGDIKIWHGTVLPGRIAGLIQVHADRNPKLDKALAQKMLRILDHLVDMGDRRSAALQTTEAFKDIRLPISG